LNTEAESRAIRSTADVILRTVLVEITRHAAVDALAALARKTKHTIEASVTTGRGLDAALALFGYVHALSAELARHAAVAGTTAGKDALLDRYAVEVVATGLDANRTDGTVVVRLAETFIRARTTNQARHALEHRPACAANSTGAANAPNTTNASIAARVSGSIASTTDYKC
jgi:hypothetical protein